MDNTIHAFISGVQNFFRDEVIKEDAAQDELNWITQDGRLKLAGGEAPLGAMGVVGTTTGLWKGYKKNGSSLYLAKFGASIKYWDGSAWQTVISGLTVGEDYCFQNYSSLAGNFVFFSGKDGLWKIHSDQPASPIALYDVTKNDAGYFIIDKGRMIMWNLQHASKTTLRLSFKDPQDARVYTTVTGEATASLAGTLAQIHPVFTVTIGASAVFTSVGHGLTAGRTVIFSTTGALPTGITAGTVYYVISAGLTANDFEVSTTIGGSAITTSGSQSGVHTILATRNCFGVTITLTGSGEVYTDGGNGILTGSLGGTGTIIYSTGVYTLTNSGVGTATYLWEDSNIKGITDFTYSATRVAGEGAIVPQNKGGDAILNVEIGQDGNYYSMKSQSAYSLSVSDDDLTIKNDVYRSDLGMPSWHASYSTNKGIIFMNTANPDKPELTILQRNIVNGNIEPVVLFPAFKFSLFDYSDCFILTTERYLMVACKLKGSTVNDRLLICDVAQGSVDISGYNTRMMMKDAGQLYGASPITYTVFQIFSGFDDNGNPVQNFWTSRGDSFDKLVGRSLKWKFIAESLKKFRRLRFAGLISVDQAVEVYVSYDDAGFQLVGTILGKGDYVDYSNQQSIGNNLIGEIQIGGDEVSIAYPFMCELKVKAPKFRKRTIKLVATGIGYVEIGRMMDWDIMVFEQRIPGRFRSKQYVSLDGVYTDLPTRDSTVSGQVEYILTEDSGLLLTESGDFIQV